MTFPFSIKTLAKFDCSGLFFPSFSHSLLNPLQWSLSIPITIKKISWKDHKCINDLHVAKANGLVLLYPEATLATPPLEPLSLSGFLEHSSLFSFLLHLPIILPQSSFLPAPQPLKFGLCLLVTMLCPTQRMNKYIKIVLFYENRALSVTIFYMLLFQCSNTSWKSF